MPKLTETYAAKLPFSMAGTLKFWDSELRGLVLFVGARSKTWYFQKDVGTKTKRELIGRFPVVSAASAKKVAMALALEWGRGRGRVAQSRVPTLREAVETYVARPKLRSDAHRTGVQRQIDLHLGEWLSLPLDQITKKQVVERHRSLAKTPSTANHVLKYFRTVWNFSRRVHDLPECPTVAIEWYPETPSGEIIGDLREWRSTIDGLENPIHARFYEFLLFTGLRKSEAFDLTWANVRDDHIHLPLTKNGRSFDLPLLPVHHEILAPLRGLSRTWVFPSPKSPKGRITNPARLAWSAHAHRRTFATVAMEAGLFEEMVGRLLNHTPLSVTGARYIRPSVQALRPAMETVCGALQERTALKR